VECPKEANAKALDILNKGVDSLSFHVKAKELNAEYLETLLNDIQAECVELNFSTCQGHVVELANLLVAYFRKKDYDVKKLKGSINYDFFNKMLTRGKEKGDMVQTAKALIEAIQPLPFYRVLNVNALSLNNAGAYISQELGYALAWGNEYMSQLTDAGVPAAIVAKKIKFNFGISSNYFLEIAKFRAARLLWANIVASYNPECLRDCDNKGANGECRCAAKMAVHAETSTFNLTLFDAHVNLLRTQTEAMSAALGGVDIILFTGGVGENQMECRREVCKDMEFMGIELDNDVNAKVRGEEAVISTPASKVKVVVIPTDEELLIASDTMDILNK